MWPASGRGPVIVAGRSTRSLEVIVGIVLVAIAVALIGLNALATAVVTGSTSYDRRQKLLQCVFIWVVPFVGALMAWSLARETNSERFTTDLTNTYSPDDGNLRLGGNSHSADHASGEAGGSEGGGGDA